MRILHDLRFFLRSLRRNWLSLGLAVGTVGISVGATVVVYAAIDALVMHPLPVQNQERLVALSGLALETPNGDPVAWWGRAQALERLALYSAGEVSVEGQGGKRWTDAAVVSPGFFQVFGVHIAPGRSFGPDDDLSGQNRLVILSHSFWLSYFGTGTSALGAELRLNGVRHTMVGIAPEGFAYPIGTNLWIPRGRNEDDSLELLRNTGIVESLRGSLGWVGRLREGATIGGAKSELGALLRNLNDDYSPKTHLRYGDLVSVRDFRDEFVRNFGPALKVLFGGAILILTAASVNCCIFLMGWAAKRRKEFAVRRAMGAGSVRILRQTLTEAAAIGAVVALIGLGTAQGLLIASQRAIPIYLLHLRERSSITLAVFFGAFFLACFVSMVANLIPTFEALSLDVAEALKDNSGPLTSTRGRVLRRSFVVLQVSLAFILAVGAVLSLQSFLNLTQTDLGYNTEGVFAAHLNFPAEQLCRAPSVSEEEKLGSNKKSKSPTGSSAVGIRVADDACRERLLSLQSQALRAAGALPYVSAVGAADELPISPPRGGPWVKRDNIEKWCPELRVAGDYFRVFQIPFVAGRTFSNSVVPEMIISERTSEALWPKGNPIGDMLLVAGEKQPRQVVGVVKDTTALEIGDQPTPQIYFPLVDTSRSTPGAVSMQLVLRCERSCGGLLPALMERLKGVGADTFVDQAATMNDLGAVVTAPVRARSMLLSSYALLGFGLALVGVFVLVSYMSVLREHELGVRMVLGAEPAELVFLLAKEGIISAGIGLLVGGVASIAAVQVLKNLLFGIDVLNLKSFAIAGFLLFAGAICAAVSAALRVRRYQPSDLLRVV